MNNRSKSVLLLCCLGLGLGLFSAWQQAKQRAANNEMARQMAAFEPAADGGPAAADGSAAKGTADTATTAEATAAAGASDAAPASDPANVAGMQVGGPFTLVDQDGKTVTDKDYDGKYKLIYFGFASCPDLCPTTLKKFDAVIKALGADAGQIVPIFITTDPERDTPEKMKDYVAMFNPAIVGLTGSKEQLKQVQDEYKVYAVREDTPDHKSYVMNHSSFTYFMGPDGKLLLVFRNEDTPEMMADNIRAIMSPGGVH
jgi:protein SCO1/2